MAEERAWCDAEPIVCWSELTFVGRKGLWKTYHSINRMIKEGKRPGDDTRGHN